MMIDIIIKGCLYDDRYHYKEIDLFYHDTYNQKKNVFFEMIDIIIRTRILL